MRMKLMINKSESDVQGVVVEIMKNIPVPALGNAASAVGLGIKPYRQGILPISKWRKMRWEKEASDKIKKHQVDYFVV